MPKYCLTDLAWAAGLVDGEGCVHIIRRVPKSPRWAISYNLGLKVTMGHKPTIDRFYAIFGLGSLHKVAHPVGPRGKANPAWTCLVLASEALVILKLIKPYSVTKLQEIEIAERFMDLPVTKAENGNRVSGGLDKLRFQLWDEMRRAKPTFKFKESHKKPRRQPRG